MTDQGPIVSQSDKRTPDVVERLGADHPLKQLGARLADLLDADNWNNIEPFLLELAAAGHRASRLEGALSNLTREVTGMFGAFEYELRTYMGHTNYAVVQTRLDEASAVLNRSLPATAGADLYPAPEKYNRGGEDCTGSTSSDGASAMQEAIAEMDRFDRYSPDIARADREAIERGVRFYCRGYVHDSHGEDRIYFSGILISGLVDAIADALSKGGGTTEGSQG